MITRAKPDYKQWVEWVEWVSEWSEWVEWMSGVNEWGEWVEWMSRVCEWVCVEWSAVSEWTGVEWMSGVNEWVEWSGVNEWREWVEWVEWVSERLGGLVRKFNDLSRTADSEVNVIHISCVIIMYTLESLSSLTENTQIQLTINLKKQLIKHKHKNVRAPIMLTHHWRW